MDALYRGRRYSGTFAERRLLARFQFAAWVIMRDDGVPLAWSVNASKEIKGLKARIGGGA